MIVGQVLTHDNPEFLAIIFIQSRLIVDSENVRFFTYHALNLLPASLFSIRFQVSLIRNNVPPIVMSVIFLFYKHLYAQFTFLWKKGEREEPIYIPCCQFQERTNIHLVKVEG